jgi:hypothetical protein
MVHSDTSHGGTRMHAQGTLQALLLLHRAVLTSVSQQPLARGCGRS